MVFLKKGSCIIGWRGVDTKFLEIRSVSVLEDGEEYVRRKEEDMRMFQTKVADKIKKHMYIFRFSPPPLNRTVRQTMWKNVIEPDRPQMTIEYGACSLHAGYLRLQTHTQSM